MFLRRFNNPTITEPLAKKRGARGSLFLRVSLRSDALSGQARCLSGQARCPTGQARCLSGQKPEIQTTKITEEPTILDNFALAIQNKWSI